MALVHGVRGRHEEGATVLHEALAAAESAHHRATIVAACRELAFTDNQAGRRPAVERWLTRANDLATSDEERAAILAVVGQNRSDTGDYRGAFADLRKSVELAERCGDRRRQAFSLSLIGRAHLLRGEIDEAEPALDRSLELIEADHWLAFLPFPEALRGEVDLARGDHERASERFERAFALGCELQDPCWEGLAARNIALLHHAQGDEDRSREWIDESRARSTRVPDRYVWMQGHVLDTAIALALDRGDDDRAPQLVRALGALAARAEMRELVVRGLVHAARIGQAGALESARLLAEEIDNPTLKLLLTVDS
jgi:tetratricopeptide (TPR) repeat protein